MRTIWSALSFFCVVQVLAAGMFTAWLWQSGRLSAERVSTVREMFAQPVGETAPTDDGADEAAAADARAGNASGAIRQVGRIEAQQRLLSRRLQDEHAQLSVQLDLRAQQLATAEADLQRQRAAWIAEVAVAEQATSDEQFRKAVKLLGELPPRQGKQQVVQLVESGGMEQAVAYLNAMSPRLAGRILKEFKAPSEVPMATDLLERLRTLGTEPELEPDEQHADPAADPSNPVARAT